MPCLTTNNTQTQSRPERSAQLMGDSKSLSGVGNGPTSAVSPVRGKRGTPSRGVKRDIEKLWEVINKQQVIIERQRQELNRLKQIVEPLSDVLKGYTDQAERRVYKRMDRQTSDQIKTNTRIDNSLATLRRSKAVTDEKVRVCTEQMSRLGAQIGSLNEEIFGDAAGAVDE